MKDIEGKDLKIGDEVIIAGKYGDTFVYKGVILRFTPQSARVGFDRGREKLCGPCEIYKLEKNVDS